MSDLDTNPEAQVPAETTELEPIEGESSQVEESEQLGDAGEVSETAPEPKGEEVATKPKSPLDGLSPAERAAATNRMAARKAQKENVVLQQQLDELKAQHQPSEPKVPDVPKYWDYENEGEFNKAVANRDDVLRQSIAYTQQQEQVQADSVKAEQARVAEVQQQLQARGASYTANATKLGVKVGDLQMAGNIVASIGIREDVAQAILEDVDGPLVTMHLASNPQLIDQLNSGTMLDISRIYETIKTAATAGKPTGTGAPPPPSRLTGGVPPTERGPVGATFE